MMNSREYLEVALGGNMNTCTLKPIAITGIMDDYLTYVKQEEQDKTLRGLWELLGNMCVDEDGLLELGFMNWPPGTDREEIWHWFDERYSKGVISLMYHKGQDAPKEEN